MELIRTNRADKEAHQLNLKMGPSVPTNVNPMASGAGSDAVDESKFDLCLVFPIDPDTSDLYDEGK